MPVGHFRLATLDAGHRLACVSYRSPGQNNDSALQQRKVENHLDQRPFRLPFPLPYAETMTAAVRGEYGTLPQIPASETTIPVWSASTQLSFSLK